MNTPRAKPVSAASLRRHATAHLRLQPSAAASPASETENDRLLHELQVHRIELELQNQELARALADLEASVAKYADLYDSAPVNYLTLQPGGKIVEANLAAVSYLGIERSLLIGRRFGFFVTLDTRRDFYALLKDAATCETVSVCEVMLKLERRGLRQVCLHARPALAKPGGPPLVRVVLEDITERKQAETRLRESEQRFRNLAEATFEGIIVHEGGVLITANDQFCEMLGYPPEELLEKQILSLTVAPESRKLVQRQIAAGGLGPYEAIGLRKDGSKFPMEVRVRETGPAERRLRLVAIRDLTARKHAEETVHETSRRLKQLSRRLLQIQESERRHLARELHDEIGQTLTAVKITLQGLKHFPDAVLLPQRLNQAIGFVDRLLHGVRKLSLNLRPPMLDDLGLVAGLRWLLHQEARPADIRARLDSRGFDRRLEPDIETACFRVAQEALTNVVRHARARQVTIALRPGPNGLRLTVRDDGRGFDVAGAQRRSAHGVSLGLLSMEERVALVGGRLEVISAPGRGTEVRAWFPTDDGGAAA